MSRKTVFVMLSGGVDSSVAATLLKEQGYTLVGCHIKCYNIDGCGERDAEDARRIAETIGIPFYIIDLEQEYKDRVVQYMIEGYAQGITPNPDVMCNTEIKFGLFLKKAIEMGTDYVATGHYTIVKKEGNRFHLYQGVDHDKDQSYFLWNLSQDQLARTLFPLGTLTKKEVREYARKHNLSTAEKKDSQGICFLGKISLRDFLKDRIPIKKGDILDARSNKIGEHEGSWMYTIGQRHGFHLEIKKQTRETHDKHKIPPYYIVKKDIENNAITVAEGESPESKVSNIVITHINTIASKNDDEIMMRIRYRQPLQSATVLRDTETTYTIISKEPQHYVAEGQSLVAYSKNGELLFGGIIQSSN